ncbi:DUF2510 domain-containing protein [Mycolicibacterium goodii]|uniref:DUF2510 domain-containing protein n=1 Tax=Mycolicibacterium goodii TaxID=134601 RepID=UPI00256EA60A|nr:DUF2510 domain-containing protein [Mycolicibacterium goodii]
MTTPPTPPPGWYPDPAGTGGRAYWNGREWGKPPSQLPGKRFWIILASIAAVLLLLAFIGGLAGDDEDESSAAEQTTTTTASPTGTTTTEAAPQTTTAAAPPPPVAPATAPPGKVMAGPESTCTSTSSAAPIDLQRAQVEVGEMAGRAGTSARVTINSAGETPATGTVLWSMLATNPAGETVQLGYKTLDGQKIGYFYFPFGEGRQYDMDGFADTDTPGEIGMVLPQAGLDKLGPVWWWSVVVNVDGQDIDSCPN